MSALETTFAQFQLSGKVNALDLSAILLRFVRESRALNNQKTAGLKPELDERENPHYDCFYKDAVTVVSLCALASEFCIYI